MWAHRVGVLVPACGVWAALFLETHRPWSVRQLTALHLLPCSAILPGDHISMGSVASEVGAGTMHRHGVAQECGTCLRCKCRSSARLMCCAATAPCRGCLHVLCSYNLVAVAFMGCVRFWSRCQLGVVCTLCNVKVGMPQMLKHPWASKQCQLRHIGVYVSALSSGSHWQEAGGGWGAAMRPSSTHFH